METTTLVIPNELALGFEDLARRTGRAHEHLMLEALGDYLRSELREIAEIEAALEEADRGEFVDAEEVHAELVKLLARHHVRDDELTPYIRQVESELAAVAPEIEAELREEYGLPLRAARAL